jgi:hypothetical protein
LASFVFYWQSADLSEIKKIPYTENSMNFYTLMVLAKKKTGASVMPILHTPDGAWISDSSDIIDAIEASHIEP